MLLDVVTRKAYRFRVYPSPAQVERLADWEGALRFLWNLANEQRLWGLARARDERKFYTAFDQQLQLTELRAELPWLADVPRNVCSQLLAELDKAWQRCFKKLARQPRWKRKGRDQLGLCESHPKIWRLDERGLHFPKLGPMPVVAHRPLEGKPKTCALVREVDQWFVAITCEIERPEPAPRTEPVVALDRGVVLLVADSDGKTIENPRHLKRSRARLARAQRVVARRKKGSANQKKARIRVAKLHRKVRRQRDHVLHEISSTYAKSHGTVIVERLNVKGMTTSAAGTIKEPGALVAQKTGLNRSIIDAGWSRLVSLLRYKLDWTGGRLVEVPAAYSSQTCSHCEAVDARSRLSQSAFCCTSCGHVDHADLNAAKVLKSRANRSALPVEGKLLEGPRRSRKRLRVPKRASENSAL